MAEEKRRDSAGRVASAIALPEWSLRRKLALALTIPMLLAATFGGLRVHTELSESDNYSATAKQITVLRPAAGYLAAAERAIIISRQRPALDDPGRVSAIDAVDVAGKRLQDTAENADLTATQRKRLDSTMNLSTQLRDGRAYVSAGQAVSQVRQLQRSITELIDAIVAAQIEPEAKLAALQQALDGRVSLAMQLFMVNVADPKSINTVDLSAELGVEQVIIDRLGSYLGTTDPGVQRLNQQNAVHFGEVRAGGHQIGDAEGFEAYDDLSVGLLDDIDKDLTKAASDARGLAIANAVITVALLVAAILLALFISRMLLNPIRRVREGALEVANTRLPEMVAKIRSGGDPGDITPIPVHTHEEMGQLARAVDDLHRQAVHLASGEARLRSQVGEMFSTLSRRNTSLINQQLGLIERLEKDEEDPNRLESLFRLDHLASRMRRTADSLMVLADAPMQTSDSDALALGDVFQAAMAGVQEYQRVQIESSPPEKVNGSAAADVVHLMTELVDNALAFSPPTAPVKISTKQAGDSTIVEISDGGLGIAQDVLNSLNEDLRSGGEVTPETARRMGLLVVSRLANRHGITVSLARNTRGGTTATVLLPPALLRGRQAQVQPKQRPGLAGLTSVKAVQPAQVAEEISNEREPKKSARPEPAAPAAPAAPTAPTAPTAPAATTAPAAFARPAAPAAPVTPAAPAAPAARVTPATPAAPAKPAAPAAKTGKPDVEVDSIAAAISAVTRLPQRSPGATRSGGAMPGAPVASTGGSLFQRLQAQKAEDAQQAERAAADRAAAGESPTSGAQTESGLPRREPATPTTAFSAIDQALTGPAPADVDDPVDEPAESAAEHAADEAEAVEERPLELGATSAEALQQDAEQRAGSGLSEVVAPIEAPASPVVERLRRGGLSNFHALNGNPHSNGSAHANGNGSSNGTSSGSSNGSSNGTSTAAPDAAETSQGPVAESAATAATAATAETADTADDSTRGDTAETADREAPTAATAYDLLDPRSPMPEPTEDETPIFRNLRSRWLSSEADGGTWTTSEIEAGWEAAEQVAEAAPIQVSESGLPMRRPGHRLVPGGVTPAAATVTRDPEAIRARLAAHAAGVSRGRTAAVDESVPAPSTEEGPA